MRWPTISPVLVSRPVQLRANFSKWSQSRNTPSSELAPASKKSWILAGLRLPITLLALPVVAVAAITIGEHIVFEKPVEKFASRQDFPAAGYGPENQSDAESSTLVRLNYATELVASRPGEWLPRQVYARALRTKYLVDGDSRALHDAGLELAKARQAAGDGTGPGLVSAEWSMEVHDLSGAESGLAAFDRSVVKLSTGEQATALELRGDVAFYRGDPVSARRFYSSAQKLEDGPGVQVRLAVLEKTLGNFDAAIGHLVDAARRDSLRTPQSLANVALQAGAIEFARGRYFEAGQWYRKADKLFAGYWKTKLYLAEAALVDGETDRAAALFDDVANQTDDPQAMDALAMLYRRSGERAKSKAWSARAALEWEMRVSELPSAYLAHAAEHELAFGNPAKALDHARENLRRRPYGEARLLYARALSANGELAAAREQLLLARKSGWKSARLFLELSQVSAALGDQDAADEARDLALELNPRILSPEATLIWFAHG